MESISLCMIVRDEEDHLARCLESVKDLVSEIIVVDTGSTDQTVAIAQSFGAIVISTRWDQDFSAARNLSLEHATKDWVLVLDADEILEDTASSSLRVRVAEDRLIGLWIPVVNLLAEGREAASLQLRAFRRRPDVRYCYRIHEQILPDLNRIVLSERWGLAIVEGSIRHDGYLPERVAARAKVARNIALFERQLAETPNDLYILFMFGDCLRRHGSDFARANSLFARAYQILLELADSRRRELTFSGELCASLAEGLLENGRVEDAWDVLQTGLRTCRRTPLLVFTAARVALEREDFSEAERLFRSCLSERAGHRFVPVMPEVVGHGARVGLVKTLVAMERPLDALSEARLLAREAPEGDTAIRLWAALDLACGDPRRLIHELIDRVRRFPRCGPSWLSGGEALFRLQLFHKALPWLMRAAELLSEPGPARGLEGECLLALGLREDAATAFGAGLPSPHCQAGIALLAIAYDLELEAGEVALEDPAVSVAFGRMLHTLETIGEATVARRVRDATSHPQPPSIDAFLRDALASAGSS